MVSFFFVKDRLAAGSGHPDFPFYRTAFFDGNACAVDITVHPAGGADLYAPAGYDVAVYFTCHDNASGSRRSDDPAAQLYKDGSPCGNISLNVS